MFCHKIQVLLEVVNRNNNITATLLKLPAWLPREGEVQAKVRNSTATVPQVCEALRLFLRVLEMSVKPCSYRRAFLQGIQRNKVTYREAVCHDGFLLLNHSTELAHRGAQLW